MSKQPQVFPRLKKSRRGGYDSPQAEEREYRSKKSRQVDEIRRR